MVSIHKNAVWGRTDDLKGLKFEYIERCMPMVWRQLPTSRGVEVKVGISLKAIYSWQAQRRHLSTVHSTILERRKQRTDSGYTRNDLLIRKALGVPLYNLS